MRLFVGVEIDPAVIQNLAKEIDDLRRRVAATAPRARVAWVPPDRLHITVRFIGEVDEPSGHALTTALTPPIRARAFPLTLEGIGTFPERGGPRVIWAGIARGTSLLAELEQEVTTRLEGCGIPREERPYRPHVTLARIREPAGLRPRTLLEGIANRRFGNTQVDAITLFLSRPGRQGHMYEALLRTPLAGRAA